MIVQNKISGLVIKIADRFTPNVIAVTIWPFIFILPGLCGCNKKLIAHEKKHLEQWKRYWIIGFPFIYIWHHYKKGYDKNPLEIEARKAEEEDGIL